MKPLQVELHIEELVLHGFSASDRHGIVEGFTRQLAELFTDRGVPPAFEQESTGEGRLDAGAALIAPGSSAETVGAQIAARIAGTTWSHNA